MFTRYSYASERSTNPLESAISLGGGGGGMFPGTINPGVHDAGSFGQSQLFGSDSIHGEVEPAIMGEPQHQANFVPVVHNFAVSVDKATANTSEKEIFFPKGTLLTIGQVDPLAKGSTDRRFNAPGTKPRFNYVYLDGLRLQPTNRDDSTNPLPLLPQGDNRTTFLKKLPLAEGTFIRPDAPVNYIAVCVADTATIHVPEPIPHPVGNEIPEEEQLQNQRSIITRHNAVGDFPAGSLVYVTKDRVRFQNKVWTDILLSFNVLPAQFREYMQFLGVLRVPYSAGMRTEGELSIALAAAYNPMNMFALPGQDADEDEA